MNLPDNVYGYFCDGYPHIVIKEIHISKISNLIPLMHNNQSVKMIHLVRDPRGVIHSRIKIQQMKQWEENQTLYEGEKLEIEFGYESIRNEAKEYCSQIEQDYLVLKHSFHKHPDIRRNYLFLRYEHLAMQPHFTAEYLYRFAGIKIHRNVHKWITMATLPNNSYPYNLYYQFTTRRNSKLVSFDWIYNLSMKSIGIIQQECSRAMELLG